MKLSAERLTAARLLLRVEGGAFSSRLLARIAQPGVRVRVLETLRWQRTLDAVLQPRCRRRLGDLDPEVRIVLRLGLAETMQLDVPPAVATDGAVRLVRRLGRSSASGLVNAVLRGSVNRWREVVSEAPVDVRLSHPEWLFLRWREHFGGDAAESSMASAQKPPIPWVWFFAEAARSALHADGLTMEAHPWCPGCWRAAADNRRLVNAVRAGAAYAQDPSSQLVAHLAAASVGQGARGIDLCAAPGGKSALFAGLARPSVMLCADRSLTRTRLMRPTLERAALECVITSDALAPPVAPHAWDLVLLDAPCTGTGTLRRHPELKWRLEPGSVSEMAAIQRELIAAAHELVTPGGVLLYSTCSVEPEENEDLFGDPPAGFHREGLARSLPEGTPWIPTDAGGIRILPHDHGDGFTVHALRRSA